MSNTGIIIIVVSVRAFPYISEALPFFLLLIDLSKASSLAKIAFKSRNKVRDCTFSCLSIIVTTMICLHRKKLEKALVLG